MSERHPLVQAIARKDPDLIGEWMPPHDHQMSRAYADTVLQHWSEIIGILTESWPDPDEEERSKSWDMEASHVATALYQIGFGDAELRGQCMSALEQLHASLHTDKAKGWVEEILHKLRSRRAR